MIKINFDIGYTSGDLTIISNKKIKKDGKNLHHCRCKCGNELFISSNRLNPKNTKRPKCCRQCSDAKKIKHYFTMQYLLSEYVEKKRSLRSIKREHKCDSRVVKHYLAKYNIPIRSRQEGQNIYSNQEVKNLEGKTFGKWKVGKMKIKYRYSPFYECVCECGFKSDVHGWSLINGKSKGCMKCAMWKGCEEIPGKYWNMVFVKAIERGLKFEISIEQVWDLFLKQNKKCAFTGILLEFRQARYEKGIDTKLLPIASLDRIDSSKGYTIDNVQWVHKDINKMKQSFSNKYFIDMCKLVVNNSVQNNNVSIKK